MPIKAVIFDMDGVLIDAKEWHFSALNIALGLFGYEISRHEHLTVYDGLPTRHKLERLSIERGLPRHLHRFIGEMKQQYTMNMIHAYCRPYFSHEYALSRLQSEGYKLALCSNSIRTTVDAMMRASNLTQYMDFTLSNEDVVNAKPAPDIYRKAIELLKLNPGECLIIEDNEHGIAAARTAGAHVMIVEDTSEVNYSNIRGRITAISKEEVGV